VKDLKRVNFKFTETNKDSQRERDKGGGMTLAVVWKWSMSDDAAGFWQTTTSSNFFTAECGSYQLALLHCAVCVVQSRLHNKYIISPSQLFCAASPITQDYVRI
jgi:hypothetical protein